MRHFIKVFILSLFIFSSCILKQDNIIIFKEFANEEWPRFEYLEGSLDVNKASMKYDLIMEVIVSDNYPNVYESHQSDGSFLFNLSISNTDGFARSKNYKFTFKDKDGYWKSKKENGYYVFQLPIISDMALGDKGTYKFKLENKYSKDPLQGIKQITIKYQIKN